MDKLAQQTDSPLITTQIGSEPLVKGVWDKYFAPLHAEFVRLLRASFKSNPALQAALSSVLPGYTWPEFADMPDKNTLSGIKSTLDRIMNVPAVKEASGVQNAAQAFLDQYNLMIKRLNQPQASKAPARKPAQPNPKVKTLQELLGVPSTGLWNTTTNTAFLNWLRANGWDKYISGNRFTGKIDDAINAINIEKASPGQGTPVEFADKTRPQRQAKRLEALKKLGK